MSEFSRLAAVQSRPISHGDRTTIEWQLAHHQQQEQHRAKAMPGRSRGQDGRSRRQDLLDADPWENSIPQTKPPEVPLTLATAADNFYSLDLTSSLTASAGGGQATMEDSFESTTSHLPSPSLVKGAGLGAGLAARDVATVHRRCFEENDFDEALTLHEGVGLQQLAQSPAPQPRKVCAPQLRTGPPQSCKCTLTLSGVTLSLLEADPCHVYSGGERESSMETEASMDKGGLDTLKYFELVSELLKDGVNQNQVAFCQEQLAQILPADHLM